MEQLQNKIKTWILQKFLDFVEESVGELTFLSDQEKFQIIQYSLKFVHHLFNIDEEKGIIKFKEESE